MYFRVFRRNNIYFSRLLKISRKRKLKIYAYKNKRIHHAMIKIFIVKK
jgi:hypothetical protein